MSCASSMRDDRPIVFYTANAVPRRRDSAAARTRQTGRVRGLILQTRSACSSRNLTRLSFASHPHAHLQNNRCRINASPRYRARRECACMRREGARRRGKWWGRTSPAALCVWESPGWVWCLCLSLAPPDNFDNQHLLVCVLFPLVFSLSGHLRAPESSLSRALSQINADTRPLIWSIFITAIRYGSFLHSSAYS